MAASFCKSCQKNNVNTRIEWKPNPQNPGKNKPFDIDKNEWHNCPYWKPDPNYKPKMQIPPDVKAEFDKIEKEVNQGDLETIKKTVIENNELLRAILILVQQWPKASELPK